MPAPASAPRTAAAGAALRPATAPVRIAVVIPCYRVRRQVLDVVAAIGPEVETIYVVDDACPEASGDAVEQHVRDSRVRVLRHRENQGVGAATLTGYRAAVRDGAEVIVKIDGDGQMDPALIPRFVRPILAGEADYTKGNRFFSPDRLRTMPPLRVLGNAILSFATKLATGYWDVFDPSNGYTAIHARVAELLPLSKISRRYFFESDMLFRLNTLRAVILDVPMEARYADETSSLRIWRVMGEFTVKNLRNFLKRIVYGYYLRSFNIASVNLLLGLLFLGFGVAYGGYHWYLSAKSGVIASSGTVMVASLPIIVGVQLLLSFLSYDMQGSSRPALHKRL
jgi:glycosyltransferase involved in cell wall biosynthesis